MEVGSKDDNNDWERQVTRIEYWQDEVIVTKPWFTFQLVPKQIVDQNNPAFNEIIELVKKAGFRYRIIETTETLLEAS